MYLIVRRFNYEHNQDNINTGPQLAYILGNADGEVALEIKQWVSRRDLLNVH
jgi:hypothetical protein